MPCPFARLAFALRALAVFAWGTADSECGLMLASGWCQFPLSLFRRSREGKARNYEGAKEDPAEYRGSPEQKEWLRRNEYENIFQRIC
jgi:hypothetical protein